MNCEVKLVEVQKSSTLLSQLPKELFSVIHNKSNVAEQILYSPVAIEEAMRRFGQVINIAIIFTESSVTRFYYYRLKVDKGDTKEKTLLFDYSNYHHYTSVYKRSPISEIIGATRTLDPTKEYTIVTEDGSVSKVIIFDPRTIFEIFRYRIMNLSGICDLVRTRKLTIIYFTSCATKERLGENGLCQFLIHTLNILGIQLPKGDCSNVSVASIAIIAICDTINTFT